MGRVWLTLAGASLCLACGGKSEEAFGQGGSTGGNVTLGSGGTSAGGTGTGGTGASGGQSGPATGGSPQLRSSCLAGTFPAPDPDGGTATLCPDAALYCEFADYVCGRKIAGGVCAEQSGCQDDDGPLCGCDGVVYPSSCAAHAAGVDIDTNGGCQLAGSFFCGGRACKLDSEACVAHLNHIGGSISPFCVPISEECSALVVSGEDEFCECVTPGRCTCEVLYLEGGSGVIKLCGDR